MIKIYSNSQTNTLFIESVAAGSTAEFTAARSGDYFSIWRKGLELYELKNVHFSKFCNADGEMFVSADAFADYLTENLRFKNSGASVSAESPAGAVNGSNAVFYECVRLRSRFGAGFHQRSAAKTYYRLYDCRNAADTFTVSPETGDLILVNYKPL